MSRAHSAPKYIYYVRGGRLEGGVEVVGAEAGGPDVEALDEAHYRGTMVDGATRNGLSHPLPIIDDASSGRTRRCSWLAQHHPGQVQAGTVAPP